MMILPRRHAPLCGFLCSLVPAAATAALLAGMLYAPSSWAQSSEQNLPLNIEADVLRHDEKRKVSIFSGNVVITRGSMLIKGGEVEITRNERGLQTGLILAPEGGLAFYRQSRRLIPTTESNKTAGKATEKTAKARARGDVESFEGEAKRIEYDGTSGIVRFIGQASARRFINGKLNAESSGETIVYDSLNFVLTLESAEAREGADATNTNNKDAPPKPQRARITLIPGKSEDALPMPGGMGGEPPLRSSTETNPK